MRFGLHSGPVTAGVLRGAKSRFQLFGDTVNTGNFRFARKLIFDELLAHSIFCFYFRYYLVYYAWKPLG